VIGSLQAIEAIKLAAGIGEPLLGRLLTYNALTQRFQTFSLPRHPACPCCGDSPVSAVSTRNETPPSPPPAAMDHPLEISVAEASTLLRNSPDNVALIDVREPWETEICRVPGAAFIPMRQIPEHLGSLPRDRQLLVMC